MKTKLSIILLVIITLFSCNKDDITKSENYKSYSLSSTNTKTEYDIQILYPANYNENQAYKTVYLLDPDMFFNETAEIIKTQYSEEVVLIGIGYKNDNKRLTDYSYPTDDIQPVSGGGKKFIQFINDELIPFIENDLSISSTDKTLLGHSVGGYFCLYIMLQQELINPFNNIVSASPSIWFADAFLFGLEEEYYNNHTDLNLNLYMTIGSLEFVTLNAPFQAFSNRIESRAYNGFNFNHKRYENMGHNNVPIISFEDGLSFIF